MSGLTAGRTRRVVATLLLAAVMAHQAPAPSAQSLDVAEVRRASAALPRLYGLVVSQRGTVLLEHYAKGYSATRPMNVKSASKSVLSALTGIAIERGLIKGLDQPVADFFPELRRDPDRRKSAITIEDLLTMRSGLESTSGRNYGRWVTSKNWVAYALGRPIVSDPGTTMVYSTGTSHVLSALLTRVTKTSTWDYARTALGPVLGPRLARWPQDPQGIYFGGNDMLLTPRQMLAFGELYLNEGVHDGKPIVARNWVRESCTPRTTSRFDPGREYGYGWWIDDLGGHRTCYAWGYGGQFILTFDALDLVVVVTSSTATSDERRGYRRDVLSLIERLILAPLSGATPPSRREGTARAGLTLEFPSGPGRHTMSCDDTTCDCFCCRSSPLHRHRICPGPSRGAGDLDRRRQRRSGADERQQRYPHDQRGVRPHLRSADA